MRIARLVFGAVLAASAVLAAPALAKNSEAQKGDDKSTSPSCSAYQQTPDGSWEQLPCKEAGERSQPQTQHRTGAQGTDQGGR